MNHPLEIEVAEGSNLSAIAGGLLNINFLSNDPNGHDVAFSVVDPVSAFGH